MAESQPSGVRLASRTAATVIELDLRRSRNTYTGFPDRLDGIVKLVIDGDLPHVMKDVKVRLPTTRGSSRSSSAAAQGWSPRACARPVWLRHGSPISHGSNATRLTGSWTVVAARLADLELVSLGFGGSALLDPFTARTIRESAADLIGLKLGVNLVNTDLMRFRASGPAVHGFLDIIREGHFATPCSSSLLPTAGSTNTRPGPTTFVGAPKVAQGLQSLGLQLPMNERAAGLRVVVVTPHAMEACVAAWADDFLIAGADRLSRALRGAGGRQDDRSQGRRCQPDAFGHRRGRRRLANGRERVGRACRRARRRG